MSYIPKQLRREVTERANNCCEYCRLSRDDYAYPFHIEHITSQKHEGETETDNLALSCPTCNTNKGSDIASNDPITGELPVYSIHALKNGMNIFTSILIVQL